MNQYQKNSVMASFFRSFLMATSLLTRIPVTSLLPQQWSDKELGLSVLWYPVIGLLMAILLLVANALLPSGTSAWVASFIIVFLWVTLTGALHLDGLADSVDAMYAGHSLYQPDLRKEKIHKVLKDPSAGPMAVIALITILLAKLILVAHLLPMASLSIIVALVISRAAVIWMIVSMPYAGVGGLGGTLSQFVFYKHTLVISAIVMMAMLFIVSLTTLVCVLSIVCLFTIFWRQQWLKNIGGFVGDTLGALIEITEVLILLTLYFLTLV